MIVTERLVIRKWHISEAEYVFRYAKDPRVGPAAGWRPHASLEESRQILESLMAHPHFFAVCLKETDEPIGCIELKTKDNTDMTDRDDQAELGYWLGVPHWGKGYATEAAKALIDYAFGVLCLSALWCGYYAGNEASARVQKKTGFTYHHVTEGIHLSQLDETRKGYVNYLSRDMWLSRRREKQ